MSQKQADVHAAAIDASAADWSGSGATSPGLRALDQELVRCCADLPDIDLERVRRLTVDQPLDSFREACSALIDRCVALIAEEPAYSRVAGRLLSGSIDRDLAAQHISSFTDSIRHAASLGLVNGRVRARTADHGAALDAAIRAERTDVLDYFGLRALLETYLLRHPDTGRPIEDVQHFWMRVAVACSEDVDQAVSLYDVMSTLAYLPSEETLHRAGSPDEQLSSCYLLDSPASSASGIRDRLEQLGQAAHAARDVSVAWHHSRTEGSLTHAIDGAGLPDTLDLSTTCVYIEPWHLDIERYLDALEDQLTGAAGADSVPALAHWIPDLFMRRVESGEDWSLFDPADVPLLPDLFAEDFEKHYTAAEAQGLARRTLPARKLFAKIIELIAADGRSWIDFKDNANRAANQTARSGNVLHAANLCTEILEITSDGEPAVCHVGAINLSRHLDGADFDMARFARTVATAVRQLDAAIDLNSYALPAAKISSERWRPIGLGIMGLQDLFFSLRLPFDGFDARQLSTRVAEALYFHALDTSAELAAERGTHTAYADTRISRGELQFDTWGITPSDEFDWEGLRAKIARNGVRNSLLVAIGPTASLSSIASCFECIEPQISNCFQRRTERGSVATINPYLVAELKQLGLWNDSMRSAIRLAGGSIQGIYQLPESLRTVYRTAWELSALAMIDLAADRGAFVDQSQSLNLFMATPSVARLSQLYLYAWRCRLKTTYALRTRAAASRGEAADPAGH
jgi:ribonucleoside-diphosphate reductase alpha chain